MTGRRLAAGMTAIAVATTIAWTSLGTVVPAASQPSIEIRADLRGNDRPPSLAEPLFLLLLGSDARDGRPVAQGRLDAIHVVGIEPVTGRAAIIAIPRDAWVRVPGHGFDRIGLASRIGGVELATRTVEQLSGCRFDYTILAGFDGFQRLVDDMGGIRLNVPRRLFERGGSNIDLREGRQTLGGGDALAWSRLREGASRPLGDRSRNDAQHELLVAALSEARRDFARSPGALLRMLAAFRNHVEHELPLAETLRLGQALLRIAPGAVRSVGVGSRRATVEGASVSRITPRGEEQFVDLCGDGVLER